MKTAVRIMMLVLATIVFMPGAGNTEADNSLYPSFKAPLARSAFISLPVGAVKPAGWLRDQLIIQANGLTGHLEEFWPDLGPDTAWKGGGGEGWERGPYYLDGLVPLAYTLGDSRLVDKTRPWIEWMLASGQPNGWFGPAKNKDRWPLAIAMKVLTQYYEATGDKRVLALLGNYFRYLAETPPDWPDREWRGVRAGENLVTAYWYYNRTGDANALKAAQSIVTNSFDWSSYFTNFPYPADVIEKGVKPIHPTHVVNIAMATKYPGLRYALTGQEQFKQAVYEGLRSLDINHGQVGGRFAGDEHLAGRRPTQGTELCGVVEFMFSMEVLTELLGDTAFADRLELLAYNSKPGTCTPDYWGHQYDQQANQVLCSVAKRHWSTNSDTSNVYGVEPNFGCCTSNMHQGWPKLVAHMWMATPDRGLAAIVYGPSEVKVKVGSGTEVAISEETEYPFDGEIHLTVRMAKPVQFPLYLRIPGWEAGTVRVAGAQAITAKAGSFHKIERLWKPGDKIEVKFPMKLRVETRYNNAVSILRGPLYFSLKIGEQYRQIPKTEKGTFRFSQYPHADWEIYPLTPWNFGLVLNREAPDKSIEVSTRRVSSIPFAQSTAPVILKVKGRAIPGWTLIDNSAGETPLSPAETVEPPVDLELIPYGCTRLRITEFPTVNAPQ
jgi:hypothetical protein